MPEPNSASPEQRGRRPLLSNGVLLFCVLVLAAVVVWQELRQPGVRRSAAPSQPSKPLVVPRGDLAEDEQSTISLFHEASPSVVHITTHRLQPDLFSLDVTEVPRGAGTGFCWDKEGHIVTNLHVIQGASTARVALADQSAWTAELVGAAADKDLAVLKIDAPAERLHPLPLGTSEDLQVGQKALAIGNPFGLDQTLTTGVISALGRQIKSTTGRPIKDVIQTDTAINPGNSGGPLLDSSGRLIGMTTAIVSPSGAYAGIGFAIPADTVNWAVPELIAHGEITRPKLGVSLAPSSFTERFDLEGALIVAVEEGSPASRAGLRPIERNSRGDVELGDVIVAIDDVPVESANDLLDVIEMRDAGDEVTLTVLRDGEEEKITVELQAAD